MSAVGDIVSEILKAAPAVAKHENLLRPLVEAVACGLECGTVSEAFVTDLTKMVMRQASDELMKKEFAEKA